jgi:hypothetical protein
MSPTITFGQSAAETVASEFGLEVREDGYLVDEEGDHPAVTGVEKEVLDVLTVKIRLADHE